MLVLARAALVFVGVLLASLAGSAQSSSPESAAPEVKSAAVKPRVVVLPPDAGAVFRSVDGGVREWWMAELEAGGIEVVPRRDGDAAIAAVAGPEKRTLHGADAAAVAKQANATHVITTELRYQRGTAEIWTRVYVPARGDVPVAAGTAKGKLAKLGELLTAASAPLRSALSIATPPEPVRLSELSVFERAGEALDIGRPADAVPLLSATRGRTADSLRAALEKAMDDPAVSLPERSRLASATGDNDPGWLQVRQGIIEGKDVELLLAGAANAESRGEHARALELNQQAAEIAPDDLRARVGSANALMELDRHADARGAWESVLAVDPDNLRAREALAHNPSLSPIERAQKVVGLADARARQLDPDGALQLYGEAAVLAPELVGPTAKLGAARTHAQLGSDDEALMAYEELGAEGAEQLGAHAGEVYAGLGEARAAAGDAAGATEAYATALGADPNQTDALQGQGELMLAAGKPGEAVAPLARAVDLAPASADARTALARAHQAAGDSKAALEALQADAVPREDQPQVLLEAAKIQSETGDLAGAQLTLQKAVSIAPDDTPLRTALAKVYAENGDAEAAAREQARVSALTGVAATASETAGKGGEKGLGGASGFTPLAEGFPAARSDGREFVGVAFIGITREQTLIEQVRSWLLPKVFDRRALEAEIRGAFADRYTLVPTGPISDLVRPTYERMLEFSTERADLSLVNDELGVEVSFVGRVKSKQTTAFDAPMTPADLQLEMRMHTGRTRDQVEILAVAANVPSPEKYMRWNPRALLPYGLFLLLCAAPFIRGWGKLTVRLDYELRKNTKGFFSIEISRGPGKARRERDSGANNKTAVYQKKGVAWSRFRRYMVQRETVFRMIPARDYYVCVHGIMQGEGGAIVGNYLEERKVRIPRNRTLEVAFDFRAKEASLEVRLQRPEGDTKSVARVALAGVPSSLKFVKDDLAMFYVGRGEYSVVVGFGECVYERRVEIVDLTPHQVTIGLGDPRQAVFEGVREAIEPFLLGDLALCARELDKAGMTQKAAELRAKYHEQQGDKAAAAKFYREAGQLTQAAELSAETGGGAESAELYEQAGDHRRAAASYLEAGDWLKAAQAFETIYDFTEAIEAYRRLGDSAKVLELLEHVGRHHEAGAAALAAEDEERAIRNFQQVDLRDPDYAESCTALASLFVKREEWALAIDRLKEALHTIGEDAAPLELLEQLGDAFEKSGDFAESLQTFESIRKRDYQYAGVTERIRALRGRMNVMDTQRQSQLNTAAAGAATARETAAATTPSAQPAEGRYEILGELGRGGMGIVFKARDRRLGRVVALKRLPDNLRDHPTAVALFLREAQSAAALNHPNIVTIYDADQADGNYYLTMEFLEGMPLDAILKKRGKLSPKDAVRMGIQIATGLQFAHERGIVHRDIKTANLFFTRDRVVKIMDFGLAKMVEEVRKAATVIGGTPYYMAPEQALGERVDHRADLYAFGVTLFELLAGSVPFREGDVTYHHRHTPPPDLRELVPGIPPELAALVAKLMGKKPEQRPATTAEVTASLDALLKAGN
jgi:tetratricopeptide (TPR) repeat protein/SAM-dependent methyltransferase